jgi:hypothetical protein
MGGNMTTTAIRSMSIAGTSFTKALVIIGGEFIQKNGLSLQRRKNTKTSRARAGKTCTTVFFKASMPVMAI